MKQKKDSVLSIIDGNANFVKILKEQRVMAEINENLNGNILKKTRKKLFFTMSQKHWQTIKSLKEKMD